MSTTPHVHEENRRVIIDDEVTDILKRNYKHIKNFLNKDANEL